MVGGATVEFELGKSRFFMRAVTRKEYCKAAEKKEEILLI
jgi:hypothetical protein